MKKYFFFVLPIFLISIFLFNVAPASAQYGLNETVAKTSYDKSATPTSIVNTVINTALSLVFLVFFVLVFYAGIRWMTAQGNEEHVTKAKNILEAAIIGLVVISAAYAITNFVLSKVTSSTSTTATSCEHTCNNTVFNSPVCNGGDTLCCANAAFNRCYADEGKSIDECVSNENICMPASTVNSGSGVSPEDVTTCANTVKDGTETDVDCGGSCAAKCLAEWGCTINADCASGICFEDKCTNGLNNVCCFSKDAGGSVIRCQTVTFPQESDFPSCSGFGNITYQSCEETTVVDCP